MFRGCVAFPRQTMLFVNHVKITIYREYALQPTAQNSWVKSLLSENPQFHKRQVHVGPCGKLPVVDSLSVTFVMAQILLVV
jgi:hypothetical protein